VWFPWDRVFVGSLGVKVGPFGDQFRLENLEGLVWGEVVKVKVRSVDACGEEGVKFPRHVFLHMGEWDEP
jgi:hypothetical protein